jgi:hypothetical protein
VPGRLDAVPDRVCGGVVSAVSGLLGLVWHGRPGEYRPARRCPWSRLASAVLRGAALGAIPLGQGALGVGHKPVELDEQELELG